MAIGRAVSLALGSIEIDTSDVVEHLRVAFSVKRDKSRDPDSAEVLIYNLSRDTRSALDGSERILCKVEAGYRDEGTSQIFFGYLHDVEHKREGTDWITRVSLADDGKKQRVKLARVNRTFPKNMACAEVLRSLVKATGIPEGNLAQFAARARLRGSPLMPRAWHADGTALEELNAFCRSLGFEYSIKAGAFQFLEIGEPLLGTGPLISGLTGMIGSPTLDDKGNVTVVSLLLPDIRPGMPFAVASEVQGSGSYVCTATEHVGDTHAGDWYVKIDGAPFKPGALPKGLKVN